LQPTAAIDLDDVTVDFVPGLLDSYFTEFGETITVGADGTWGEAMVQFLQGTDRLRAAGYKSTWDWLRDRDWLWATFPAIDGAIGGVQTLRHMGFFVEAVTSKPEWARPQVYRWLGKWRVPFDRVTFVVPGQSKLDVSDAAFIVDDKLDTCREWVRNARNAIWFDRYSHGVFPTNYAGWRARTWDDVLTIVREEGL